ACVAVMGVMMFYTMHFPTAILRILWIIPIEMRWFMVLCVIFDLHPVLLALARDKVFSGVAHAAHLGGLAFGFAYAKYQWRLGPIADWIRLPRIRWPRPPPPRPGPGAVAQPAAAGGAAAPRGPVPRK